MKKLSTNLKILLLVLFSAKFLWAQNLGDPDPSFQTGAGFISQPPTFLSYTPSGKILVTGDFNTYNGTAASRLALLDSNGALDLAFQGNATPGANGPIRSAAIDSMGRIYIGGLFTSYGGTTINRLARLLPNGNLDPSFSPGTGPSNEVTNITIAGNRILIAGFFNSYNGTPVPSVAALNFDGTLDTTFNQIPPPIGNQTRGFQLYPDGRILVFGNFNAGAGSPVNRIARLLPDGSLDSTFVSGQGANGTLMQALLMPDGKIYIAGGFTAYNGFARNRIARLNPNGDIDPTFEPGTGASTTLHNMVVQPDGKILIMSNTFNMTYQGVPSAYMARIDAQGNLDTSFGNAVTNHLTGSVLQAFIQSDGKLLISGNFTTFKQQAHVRIMRLFLDSTAVLPIPVSQNFANFQLEVIGGLPTDTNNNLTVWADSIPFVSGGAATWTLNLDRTSPTTWAGNLRVPVSTSFGQGAQLMYFSYACRLGDSAFSLSPTGITTTAGDTTWNYVSTSPRCQGGYPLNIHVMGTLNSAGTQAFVNEHTTLIILKRSPTTTQITIADTLFAAATGGPRNWMIRDTTMLYSAVALPNSSHSYLFNNNIPTYLGNAIAWQQMAWITGLPAGRNDTIALVPNNPQNGTGTAGGYVFSANGNKQGDPEAGILMLLSDSLGVVVDFAYTDATGDFRIEQLDPGTFMVRAEVVSKRPDEVWFQLGTGQMQLNSLDFEVKETEVVFVGNISLDAIETNSQFKVYPNPAQAFLVISGFTNALPEMVVLIDNLGKTIPVNWRKTGTEVFLDLEAIAPGSYTCQLQFIEQHPLTFRVIKQ
jgi:uncharacterized delta-60 repeat protein